jgi:lipopolysaccharide transport system permease protein
MDTALSDIQQTQEPDPGGPVVSAEARKPLVTIRPKSGWAALDLIQVWQYRDLLLTLASRDVKLRYRQTALGVVWVILQPLVAAGIFSFVFGTVAKMPSPGKTPYIVFSYAGLLGWNIFSSTLSKVSGCLVGNANLISKVFFPRLVLPLSNIVSTLIDFVVALGMMGAMLIFWRINPGWSVLMLPVWVLLMLMFSTGIGLFAAALMVTYRDVQYILPVVTGFLMYASPVAYAVAAVPAKYQTIYSLNPLSGLLEAFRWSLLAHTDLPPGPLLYSIITSVIVFVLGAFAFKKMERKFADVI